MTKGWAQNKVLIKALYMDQKLTLKETKRIMEEQHGFLASYVIVSSAPGVPSALLPDH